MSATQKAVDALTKAAANQRKLHEAAKKASEDIANERKANTTPNTQASGQGGQKG